MAGYLFDSCTQYTVQAFVCTSLTRWTWKPKASLDWKWLLNEDRFEFEFMVCLTQELGNINRPDSFLSLNSFCWFCLFFISCTAVSNISSTLQQNIWYLHSPLSLSPASEQLSSSGSSSVFILTLTAHCFFIFLHCTGRMWVLDGEGAGVLMVIWPLCQHTSQSWHGSRGFQGWPGARKVHFDV